MDMNIEDLNKYDRHGIYRKKDGNLVVLPIRRHLDWLQKGMTFICAGDRVDSESVRKKADEDEKKRSARAREMIKKYGSDIKNDLPELFEGFNLKDIKSQKDKEQTAKIPDEPLPKK